MLNITNLREIQIKTTISPYFLPIRIATIKNTEYNQCWWECRKIATLMYYWFRSVAQLSPTLCNPMDCSMSGLPVHHQLLELAQIHAHWVGDVIQSYHPLLSSFPPAFNLSQHQSFPVSQFFVSGGLSIGVSASASVSPMNTQDWFPFGMTGLISLLSQGLSYVFFNTTVQKHQFFSAQLSLWANSHIHTWLLEKP